MNAHTPFDANQDWSNPYCQNSSNDPMVDALLGNAYHVVRTVYCNLGNLKLIYDFLNQYGMVLGVQSEAELKALTTKAKYARIYGFSRAGDRQVTDYLYVEGDRTGIIPDDPKATGSWITVATSGSNSGGTSSGEGAYIPWVYDNGSAAGGETTINVPDGTVGVPFIIINGDMQYVGRGFEFNADSLSVTLAQPLEEGDEVVFLLTGVPAVPDNPNVNDWVQINWLYNNGAAIGGEQVIAIPYTFQSVPAVYKNGLRLYKGLATESYTADPDNQRILLTEPLATNDRLIVQIGGEAQVLETADHTLQEVARATNVKDSEVILSTDTTQFLNNKKVIYSVSEQKAYGLPVLPTNVFIQSVSNGKLIYSPGSIEVDLIPVPNSAESLEQALSAENGASLIVDKLPYAGAVPRTQHDINSQFSNILDFLGDGYDGTTDAAGAFISANTLVPKSREIVVPSGVYLLNSDVDCSGRRFTFEEPVTFTGIGKFYRAIVNRIMPDGTTRVSQWAKPGTTEYMTASAVFGDNGATATGIQIGGAVPYNGTDGVMMFTDGSSGWLGVRASKWPHPTEMAIYPSSKAGSCQTISGSNAVKRLSGASITAEAIGKPISIYDSLYTISTITADGFTVKNINGTPVTWGSTATHSFILCYYNGSGLCSVSGTTVTRISGDPFVIPDPTVPQTMTINGIDYRVVSFTDPQHVTLNSAPGDSALTEYKFWGTVNSLNSALRIHRLNAAGFEENISLIANNAGYFALHAAAGNPANEQYPIYIGSGWEDNGQMRKSIISAGNGDVTLGGGYGNGPLYVPYNQTSGRPQVMVDNSTGTATISSTGGPTPDASLAIKAKGTGRVVFHSEVGVNAAIYPYIDNVYSCGQSGNRWSQIWASNATIQTSDGTTKTAVQASDLSTDFILGLNPVSYKNIVGGNVVEEVEDGVEEIERQVVEKVTSSEEVHERVVDGDEVYYVRKFVNKEVERPVFHDVELRDELGNVIGTIKTPLMEKVVVPKTRQVITPVPGKRTHYGFIAQEVKDLVDELGISDFGGYVEGEDGKLGLRYGEFISPIVSCLQDIIKRLELLEKK
ncbi:tail protein [Escherichia phage vB_EcoP-ZQ2]|uniref:Peptidase S74 domain-containing protein n=1 Tax=Escherichia phage vB_EcoP-ZQ2 TaxID=2810370 RepID=A0A8F3HKT3_9CAUD|nr:tail protein [Escherichia phage vB_EcoP-ZQ2]QWY13162.1 hypothetical protein [Escherichia phage vB_EcoP-ZQ2]